MPEADQTPVSTATVLHHVPGRLRLSVPSVKGQAGPLEQLRRRLWAIEGVRQVTANPILGSFVIQYDPQQFAQFPTRLQDAAHQDGLFQLEHAFRTNIDTDVSLVDRSLGQFATDVNRRVQTALGDSANLKELFPLGILLYAVFFVDKAVKASQWLSWAQFAFEAYMELHQDEPVAELAKAVEALRVQVADGHQESIAAISRQLEEIRVELRALAERDGRGQA